MSDAEEHARKERRRQLIERLNEKEAELATSPRVGSQLSEEQLDAAIEKERQRNLSRQGFPYTGIGG